MPKQVDIKYYVETDYYEGLMFDDVEKASAFVKLAQEALLVNKKYDDSRYVYIVNEDSRVKGRSHLATIEAVRCGDGVIRDEVNDDTPPTA